VLSFGFPNNNKLPPVFVLIMNMTEQLIFDMTEQLTC